MVNWFPENLPLSMLLFRTWTSNHGVMIRLTGNLPWFGRTVPSVRKSVAVRSVEC
jgi:hypothetical protein